MRQKIDPPSETLRTRLSKRLILTLLAPLFGLLAAELALRWLLLSPSDLARSLGASLRVANFYADRFDEEDYWKLHLMWEQEPGPVPFALYHPTLGWTSDACPRQDLSNRRKPRVGARRPI